jgi:hypothetical protein
VADIDVVEALEVHRDLRRAEVIVLPQVNDLPGRSLLVSCGKFSGRLDPSRKSGWASACIVIRDPDLNDAR